MCECKFEYHESYFRCKKCKKIIKAEYIEIMLNLMHRNLAKEKSNIDAAFFHVIDYALGIHTRPKRR